MAIGKLIAVSGPPGCGKTTFTLKLAQEVYDATKKKVAYLSPDTLVPALGQIFPLREKKSLRSLGAALEKVDLTASDLLGVIATTKARDDMGYLGYIPGESAYTYPNLQEDKVVKMFALLQNDYDYIFVDCDRQREDLISSVACGLCDHLIQLVNPDKKSVAYYSFEQIQERAIQVLNLLDNDVYLPIPEARDFFPNIQFKILYSRPLKMQWYEGELADLIKDPVYRKALKPIVKIITKEPEEAVPADDMAPEENAAADQQAAQVEFWK